MEKKIGKLYSHTHTENRNDKKIIYRIIIMCTGMGDSDRKISGVVVDQTDEFSDFQIGDYSNSWTFIQGFYEEYKGEVLLNNKNWKEKNNFSCSAG